MKITYEEKSFRNDTMAIIDKANEIIDDYSEQGFSLTLRQLYYQFVARDLIPNTEKSYKRLGGIINDARMAGLIDWAAIEDRTRNLVQLASWTSPQSIISNAAYQFKLDWWEGQEYRPEVWIEKEALVGVIEEICNKFDVPFFACRGYVSQSEMWRAGQRAEEHFSNAQMPIIIHLGDHDPSGIDMTRDNGKRISLFGSQEVEIRRIALNMDQIEEYSPPPNPAKMTDSRFDSYMSEYGDESWELDALEPKTIVQLIEDEITSLIDSDQWEEIQEKEFTYKKELGLVSANWEKAVKGAKGAKMRKRKGKRDDQ